MKTKISYYVALSVVTLGAMAAVVLSNNGSHSDNNFKNNDEVIYLNKQNLIGEKVEDSALKFESSKMFAFYDKTKDSKESLRFAVAVKGEIDSINYTRAAIDGSYGEQVESITKVYRGLKVEGNTFYYDGETLTTNESAQEKYYWAVYNINYDNTVTDKIVGSDEVIKFTLTINGNEQVSLSSSLEGAKLGGGDGSETKPYLIYSQAGWDKYVKDANANAENFSKKYISLVASSITSKTMIKEFYGNFDGHNNKINAQIKESSTNNKIGTGLFSANRGGIIENLVVEGSVEGIINTAGIAGINDRTIRNCVNYASIVNNGSRAGGITAYSRKGSSVINCENNGVITGQSVNNAGSNINSMRGVGGIVGVIENNTTNKINIKLENCHNKAQVDNNYQAVGGIVGLILSKDNKTAITGQFAIKDCTNSGKITSGKSFAGGILGVADNKNIVIDNCHNLESGVVTGTFFVGGIAGAFGYSANISDLKDNAIISNCSNAATIIATTEHAKGGYRVGGITGMAWGTQINECKNSADVKGADQLADKNKDTGNDDKLYIGHLVGYKTGTAKIDGE